jgi:hypothetical protein
MVVPGRKPCSGVPLDQTQVRTTLVGVYMCTHHDTRRALLVIYYKALRRTPLTTAQVHNAGRAHAAPRAARLVRDEHAAPLRRRWRRPLATRGQPHPH